MSAWNDFSQAPPVLLKPAGQSAMRGAMRAQCGNHAVLEEKACSVPLSAAPSLGYFKYLSS